MLPADQTGTRRRLATWAGEPDQAALLLLAHFSVFGSEVVDLTLGRAQVLIIITGEPIRGHVLFFAGIGRESPALTIQ